MEAASTTELLLGTRPEAVCGQESRASSDPSSPSEASRSLYTLDPTLNMFVSSDPQKASSKCRDIMALADSCLAHRSNWPCVPVLGVAEMHCFCDCLATLGLSISPSQDHRYSGPTPDLMWRPCLVCAGHQPDLRLDSASGIHSVSLRRS